MPKSLSISEVCKEAKISRAMLYKLWKMKLGPKRIKIGARSFVLAETLEQWLKSLEK